LWQAPIVSALADLPPQLAARLRIRLLFDQHFLNRRARGVIVLLKPREIQQNEKYNKMTHPSRRSLVLTLPLPLTLPALAI
jgi:hypothetical protein